MPTANTAIHNVLNYNFGATAYPTFPTTLYFGLSKDTFTATTSPITGEPSTGSYARKAVTNNTTNWNTSVLGSLTNKTEIKFVQSSGVWSTDISPIVTIFISDSATTGGGDHLLWYQTLVLHLVVPTLTYVSFPIGTILVTQSTVSVPTLMVNNILNYNFGAQTYSTPTFPSTLYFGLSTLEVTAVGMSSVAEPAGSSGYARVSKTNNKTTWTVSSGGTPGLHNDVSVAFPSSSASWGVMRSIFIADSATNGNVLWFKKLNPGIVVQTGTSPVTFDPTDIAVTMT